MHMRQRQHQHEHKVAEYTCKAQCSVVALVKATKYPWRVASDEKKLVSECSLLPHTASLYNAPLSSMQTNM